MLDFLIKFLLPFLTLIIGFFGKRGADKYANRNKKLTALETQSNMIDDLFVRLAKQNQASEERMDMISKSFQQRQAKEKERHKCEIDKLRLEIKELYDKCDCP